MTGLGGLLGNVQNLLLCSSTEVAGKLVSSCRALCTKYFSNLLRANETHSDQLLHSACPQMKSLAAKTTCSGRSPEKEEVQRVQGYEANELIAPIVSKSVTHQP